LFAGEHRGLAGSDDVPEAALVVIEMSAHESPRTMKLYDRTKERLTRDEVERIRF
jgi:hypothetical protein